MTPGRAPRTLQPARDAAWLAIGAYQRWASPLKGFGCACRVHEGRASCSALGRRAIRMYGVRRGCGVLRARLRHCGEVHRRFHPVREPVPRRALRQRGDCDPGCGDLPCDLPGGSGSGRRGSCLQFADCGNCGCDGCGDDRRDRDTLAEWGPTILCVLAILLTVALGVIMLGCTPGACDAGAWPLLTWWVFFGLTCLLNVIVLVLRVRRAMAPFTTIGAACVLTALGVAAAGGVERWTRWFGL